MLGLGCLPCSDIKQLNTKNSNHTIELTATHSDYNDKHLDFCNPFCSCTCCGVTQTNQKIVSFEVQMPGYLSTYMDTYVSYPTIAIALPIWQPPQLAS